MVMLCAATNLARPGRATYQASGFQFFSGFFACFGLAVASGASFV